VAKVVGTGDTCSLPLKAYSVTQNCAEMHQNTVFTLPPKKSEKCSLSVVSIHIPGGRSLCPLKNMWVGSFVKNVNQNFLFIFHWTINTLNKTPLKRKRSPRG